MEAMIDLNHYKWRVPVVFDEEPRYLRPSDDGDDGPSMDCIFESAADAFDWLADMDLTERAQEEGWVCIHFEATGFHYQAMGNHDDH